jgi:hypothetical protein
VYSVVEAFKAFDHGTRGMGRMKKERTTEDTEEHGISGSSV